MDSTTCDIYACRNKALLTPSSVEIFIDGEMVKPELCDEHRAFFKATPPDKYEIGRTFTGEIEVRPVPARPAAPTRNPANIHTTEQIESD